MTDTDVMDRPVDDMKPLFLVGSDADTKARTAPPPADMPADPEAPYGWMVDRETGERRPRKSPGRQAVKGGGGRKIAAPRKRPANRARVTPATIAPDGSPAPERSYAAKADEILQTAWMMAAMAPIAPAGVKVGGVDAHAVTVRVKASAALVSKHRQNLAQSLGTIADHNDTAARIVDSITGNNGAGWLLPACMAVVPFAMEMARVWRGGLDETVVGLAQATVSEWSQATRSAAPAVQDQGAATDSAA